MTTFLLLALLVVMVPAMVSLFHATHHAVEGYEDELQFHTGVAPRPGVSAPIETGVAVEQIWIEGTRSKRRPQLAPTDHAKA